jgi:signal transduction histidine kinase
VRHDLWGSRALVSRVLARFLVGAIACVVALGIGAAFAASLGVPFRAAFLAAAAGALSAAPLVYLAMRAVERRLFPAAERYKPTIEQLSEDLASTKDPREIAVSVERTVRRWLACDRVAFHTAGGGNGETTPDAIVEADDLTIPARFGGRTLGVLAVGPKRGAALFTTDDLDLLRTIANQAALALAHAHNYMELEERRQQQAAAWQAERLALVETLAAEIAHEVRYPINFFRSVFRRDANRGHLDEEEIDIGCEEVERLERLVSGLRRVVSHRVERRVLRLTGLSGRVEMLLRDALRGRTLRVDVPDDMALRCDPDQATQALTNLVSNAVDATGPDGSIGIQWSATARGGELVVWDDGAGFEGSAAQLFVPWFTTKPRGTGLGLAITQRIVRAHGWGIDARRVDGKTHFVVAIPPSDLIVVERKTPLDDDPLPARGQGDEQHENPDR